MFGPRNQEPVPVKKAKTCDLVFEGGKPFLVLSFEDDPWEKREINNDQLWGLFMRMAHKLRGR